MLIEEGAVELIVPGNLPIGCNAVYLTLFGTSDVRAYDKNGCLKAYNAFSKYHNSQLKIALDKLRPKYPHAKISYADYYGAAKRFFHAPKHYGECKSKIFHINSGLTLIICFIYLILLFKKLLKLLIL